VFVAARSTAQATPAFAAAQSVAAAVDEVALADLGAAQPDHHMTAAPANASTGALNHGIFIRFADVLYGWTAL
jgi:hypothetical protein